MIIDRDAETIFKNIQRRVAHIRAKKNLSQEELAELLNVESRTIRRWECQHEMRLTLWALCRLSLVFGCPLIEFLDGVEMTEKRTKRNIK